ncbi:MAG: DinB family protein [Thermoanaerobaculia bacterium]
MAIALQNIRILDQGLEMLRVLDDEVYGRPALGGRASAGAHLRHVVDYYKCFLGGLAGRRIDYDARQRDPDIESSTEVAGASIAEIVAGLEKLAAADAGTAVEVKVDAAAAQGSGLVWSRSSVGRELQFLLSHTVHHYALIAMTLRSAAIELGDEFGVAPSTIEYRRAGEAVGAR